MEVIKKSTPNLTNGREGKTPNKVIIHWIGSGDEVSTVNWFASANSKVSAHYLVADDRVYQFVDETDTAWHAGNWDVNLTSIGIEHEATPTLPVTEATYKTSGNLVREICKRWNIPIDREHIKKHSEIKSTQCPGTIDIDKIINLALYEEDDLKKKVEELEKELDEMRDSRDKWKRMFNELEEKYVKESQQATEHIKNLQSTVSEQNLQISTMNETTKMLENEKRSLLGDCSALRQELVDLTASKKTELDNSSKVIQELNSQLADCEKEIKKLKEKLTKNLNGYSKWSRFWSLFK